ncbi:hypothetical protein [Corynebacterium glutamicum]|uniref:hypothetical protein n=1 Tax=Corynebacterium glutamicum TaxID=1718 RepID=UPI0014666931|nr:hypothetical protein [Corynebacterium glutamicum]GFK19276.1 hypothetical protein KbCgl_18480 [Corynebacterium glutamicum]
MASKEFDINDLVEKILADPALDDLLMDVAEDFVDVVKATWPKSIGNETTKWSVKDEVFEIVPTDSSGRRPWVHVHVNHPYAVAHQARTGAFTKAAESLGYEFRGEGENTSQ